MAGNWSSANRLAAAVPIATLAVLAAFPAWGAPAAELPAQTQAGDLIFREGTETVSAAVRAVDGGQFSHVGMLIGAPGHWQVLHATPSEVPGRPDGVVLDNLAFFLDRQRSRRYAVYHVDASAAQRTQAITAAHAMLGKPFRVADEAAGTYCTALVWNAWKKAGVDMGVRWTPLSLPLLPAANYLLPSDLLASPKLRGVGD
jgi:cell wall-associated NlpC family hydrolase